MHTSDRAVADLVQLVQRRYLQCVLLQGAATLTVILVVVLYGVLHV